MLIEIKKKRDPNGFIKNTSMEWKMTITKKGAIANFFFYQKVGIAPFFFQIKH